MSMFIFSMQHGMIWIGNPFLPSTLEGDSPEHAVNRLSSWTGAMAQTKHGTAAEQAFVPGDLLGAELFGRNFAQTLGSLRAVRGRPLHLSGRDEKVLMLKSVSSAS